MTARTETVSVAVDEPTLDTLTRLAQARGQSISDVIREALGLNQTLEARITAWLATDDTGASSESLAFATLGHTPRYGCTEPADSSDLGRCLRLIARVPETRATVDVLAGRHSGWARLAPYWDELAELGRAEGLLKGPRSWSEVVDRRMRELRHGRRS